MKFMERSSWEETWSRKLGLCRRANRLSGACHTALCILGSPERVEGGWLVGCDSPSTFQHRKGREQAKLLQVIQSCPPSFMVIGTIAGTQFLLRLHITKFFDLTMASLSCCSEILPGPEEFIKRPYFCWWRSCLDLVGLSQASAEPPHQGATQVKKHAYTPLPSNHCWIAGNWFWRTLKLWRQHCQLNRVYMTREKESKSMLQPRMAQH